MFRTFVITASMLVLAVVASTREATLFRAGGAVDGKKAEPGDRAKIVDRLRIKYQDVLDQLTKNDPGADTLAMQKEIAELLKRLLEQDDPPQDQTSNPPPSSPPSSAQDPPPPEPKAAPVNPPPAAPNEPKPVQRNAPPSHAAKPQPPEKSAAHREPTRGESDRSAKSFEELKKQLQTEGRWPLKLPPRHRDDIDVSGSGRFMPRYEELLRAYYRTIAESGRDKRDE